MTVNFRTSARGAITWHTPHEIEYRVFYEALCDLGFRDCKPPLRSIKSSLERAGKAVTTSKDSLVIPRTAPARNGVEIHAVTKNEDRNDVVLDFGVKFDHTEGRVVADYGYANEAQLQDEFDRARSLVPTNSVSMALLKILKQLHGSISLKESGGIYWVPPTSIDRWCDVRDRMRAIGASDIVVVAHDVDPDLAREVISAFTKEVILVAGDLADRAQKGTLTEDQCNALAESADELAAKCEIYSAALDDDLPNLKATIGLAKRAAVNAAMKAMSKSKQLTMAW